MHNQSEHAVIRSHLTAEHVPKADKAFDYSLKSQELKDATLKIFKQYWTGTMILADLSPEHLYAGNSNKE